MNDDEYFRIMVDYATRLIKDNGGIEWWEPTGKYVPAMGKSKAIKAVRTRFGDSLSRSVDAVNAAVDNIYKKSLESVAEKRTVFDATISGEFGITSITEVMNILKVAASGMSIGDVELRFDYSKSEWTLKIYH